MQRKKVMFAFDLKIEKRVIKLQVYEDDYLQDLIQRFSKAANLSERFYEKIKEKLENQFRRLIQKQNCSQKIRNKIQQFLEESKIVIIGVSQTEAYQPNFNETPLRMLKEKTSQPKKTSNENYKMTNHVRPIISKHTSKQIYVQQVSEEETGTFQISKSNHPKGRDFINSFTQFQERNLSRDNYNNSKNLIQQKSKQIKPQQQRAPSLAIQNSHDRNSYYNSFEKEKKPTVYSSYQLYKMEKSHGGSVEKKAQLKYTPKKAEHSGQENIIPSKSYKSFKMNPSQILESKFNSNDYSCMDVKGAAWGFKQQRKFNYLAQGAI